MRTVVDPRFAARRIEVREGWARRRLRWLVTILALVMIGAIGYALLQSPWLSVRSIAVEGASHAAVTDILATNSVYAGMPTVAVRPEVLEAELRTDPWVADVDVVVTWPGAVEIRVLERTEAAWVRTATGWALMAFDGMLLEDGEPAPDAATMVTEVGPMRVGEFVADQDLVGAGAVLGLLPSDLATMATARVLPSGIEADIDGHRVLFGNGRDIPAKVAAVVAILESGAAEPGAVINVISPSRPGINNPQPVVEGDAEEVSPTEDSG